MLEFKLSQFTKSNNWTKIFLQNSNESNAKI